MAHAEPWEPILAELRKKTNPALEVAATRFLKEAQAILSPPQRTSRCSLFRLSLSFQLLLLLYYGFLPHLAVYTCGSLMKHNYLQFDFISIPSLLKGVTCVGFAYSTLQRQQGVIEVAEGIRNGTLSAQGILSKVYDSATEPTMEWVQGKRNMSSMLLYQDVAWMSGYVYWSADSIWYTCTHSASESTRVFIHWLNAKTEILRTLRDAFIELPVIKQIRDAVRVAEETVHRHIIQPVQQKIKEGMQCAFDAAMYYGRRLIQWGDGTRAVEELTNVLPR